MKNQDHELFRQALNEELVLRMNKNPHYSIRSFAQSLEIESSSLSQILKGSRKLTDKMCIRLGEKLGYGELKIRALSREYKVSENNFLEFERMEEDKFKFISDWYYYAILELTHCQQFKPSISWVAKTLELNLNQTKDAVERLQRLGFLEIKTTGEWVDKLGDANNFGNDFYAPAFTEHQKQIVKKALEALDKTPYEKRVQSSMTVAVSKKKVVEAKKMIHSFIEELNDFLRTGDSTDEVYNISVSLYPVSQITDGDTHEK